jgi:outer membrane protein assembly factor BamB
MMFVFLSNLVLSTALLLSTHATNFVSAADAPAHPPNNNAWSGWGANIYNNRWASENNEVNSTTIRQLVPHCKLDYPKGVSATPVVLNNTAYYPTGNGSFYALNIGTCEYVWHVNVTKVCYDYQPVTPRQMNNSIPMSRTSPQIDGNTLYFATQTHALIVAVKLDTGNVLGTVQVSDHPLAVLTMSPTVYNGNIFIGASSQEESATADPTYKCCNFIGVFAAYSFDTKTNKFKLLWNVHTLPKGKGWAGASVWGSQPAIDPARNQVFIGTGNTYVYPTEYEKCLNKPASCLPSDVWQESIIALDISTGKVNWRKSISPLDGWVMSCGYAGAPTSSSALCPFAPGPDADFGMAPTFVPAALGDGTTRNDSVIIGQKNGNLYSVNAVTGDIQWNIITSPDSDAGGLSWGIAVDNFQIYFTAINFGSHTWIPQPVAGYGAINNSAFGAANLKTGHLVWETPTPDNQLSYSPPGVVNDLVFVGQSGSTTEKIPGAIIALSKINGTILQKWPLESVQHGGIMASGGFVMFGTGYHYANPFDTGSFCVYGLPSAIKAARGQPKTQGASGGSDTEPGAAGRKSSGSKTGVNTILAALYPFVLLVGFMVNLG